MENALPSVTVNYQLIPIELLKESKTNPRRRFEGLEELADSIRRHGLLDALLVRPSGEAFEVVAGHRRLRAARMAGLKEIKAELRELTDDQVLEIQLIENLQRAGIHPLDEARGYQQLIEQAGYTEEHIADRIGKNHSYIAQRLALTRLTKEAEAALVAGKFSSSHAVMIARLQPVDQKRALDIMNRWAGTMTRRQLSEWIQDEVYRPLREAPFDLKDRTEPSCQGCLKRTGSATALFSDVKRDMCTDPACYQRKEDAHVQLSAARLEASGQKFVRVSGDIYQSYRDKKRTPGLLYRDQYIDIEPDSAACAHAVTALVVQSHGRGAVGLVCASRSCPVHWGKTHRSSQQLAGERKAKIKAQQREKMQQEILREVLEWIDRSLPVEIHRIIVRSCFEMAGHDVRRTLCKWLAIEPVIVAAQGGHKNYHAGFARHIEKLDTGALNRMLLAVILMRSLVFPFSQGSLLEDVAKRLGVKLEETRKRVTKE